MYIVIYLEDISTFLIFFLVKWSINVKDRTFSYLIYQYTNVRNMYIFIQVKIIRINLFDSGSKVRPIIFMQFEWIVPLGIDCKQSLNVFLVIQIMKVQNINTNSF